ncbi:ethanolamine ammonia-lyase subunit EutB [Desulfospira joergensenii]|uniref:ethanolamine ammonia-lyase subunit EutB n=1 Tax=Desulfospira joergensenii TaxID=53329 RepID=UPI0003B523C1|nr:ethanolamine ammonia-lyase subunit EutB [Desulfospira joergensenii]
MKSLTSIIDIQIPEPRPDKEYTTCLMDRTYTFQGLKHLLGAADYPKAGDCSAGLAAADEAAREAARALLSSLTLKHLFEHPLTDDSGQVDSVMRVNYDIDGEVFDSISHLTLGEVKDKLMGQTGEGIKRIGRGLTGPMAAALAKLMDVHELIFVSKKIETRTKARTGIGQRGTLSSRLQPNHPTDDTEGLTLLTYLGLSMGSGDCLIGVNPAEDTVKNITAVLEQLDAVRRQTGAPTQICVLGHVKTQTSCLEQGAPVEILFQSLAGTDQTLVEEFDVTVDDLDAAWDMMNRIGPLRDEADQMMYFETGQGSEVSYGKHNGMDMTTCEALCYGLARRYNPFMVNNVTGFIGPETHRDDMEMVISNLQDHFMGKLMGLPMGMAPCYTLHSNIASEGQQIATELLTAAGANYYMDVYLNTDRMLAYFDTSSHDDQTLREIHGRSPAPEFAEWAVSKGIYIQTPEGEYTRGPNWGNPKIFCRSETEFQALLGSLPAAYGFENAGPRPANQVSRTSRFNQATARNAIYSDLDPEQLIVDGLEPDRFKWIFTAADSREAHLNDPEKGTRLSSESRSLLGQLGPSDVRIVLSDGLSADAIHHNIPDLLPVLMDGLQSRNLCIGEILIAPFGRVKLAEAISGESNPRLVIMLIGERPGGDAHASKSMSAYLMFPLDPSFSDTKNRHEYTVISNIYSNGLPPLEAGSLIAEKALEILRHQAAGNRLEKILKGKTIESEAGSL